MKIHVILIIILILVITLPISSASVNATPATSSSTVMRYNFSEVPAGGFPQNGGGFTFTIINESDNYHVRVEHTPLGNGLNIFSEPVDGNVSWTSLGIGFPINPDMDLSISFEWNYNSSYTDTASNLFFESSGSTILRQYFGPIYGKESYLSHGSTVTMGSEPQINTAYTANISITDGISLYYSFGKGNGTTSLAPLELPIKRIVSGSDGELLIGAPYCNITIFSISVENLSMISDPAVSTPQQMNISSYGSFTGISQTDRGFSYDPYLNSLIFLSPSNSTVNSVNLENKSIRHIIKVSGDLNESYSVTEGHDYYVLINGDSDSRVLRINQKTLTADYVGGLLNCGAVEGIVVWNHTEAAIICKSHVVLDNLSTSSIHNFTLNGSEILNENISGDMLSLETANSSTGLILFYDLDMKTLKLVRKGESELAGFPSFNLEGSFFTRRYSFSLLNNNFSSGNYISFPGVGSLYVNGSMRILSGYPGGIVVSLNGSYYLVNSTDIDPLPFGNSSVFLTAYNNSIIVLRNGSIYTYFNGSDPFPNPQISVAFHLRRYYTGMNATLNFTAVSSSRISATAAVDGKQAEVNGQSIQIVPENLKNGTNYVNMTVTNQQGYVLKTGDSFNVDDFRPEVAFQNNVSSSETGSVLNFSIARIPYRDIYSVFYNGSEIEGRDGNYSINLPAGLYGNNSFLIEVEDIYGRSYNLSFSTFLYPEINTGNLSIQNGSYLKNSSVYLEWHRVANISFYRVYASGPGELIERNLTGVGINLSLVNGNWSISVYGIFPTGREVSIGNTTFHVMTYSPGISLLVGRRNMSFYGNQGVENWSLIIHTNTTSNLIISIVNAQGRVILSKYYNNTEKEILNLSGYKTRIHDGSYRVCVNATGHSGLSETSSYEIRINNTIPSMNWVNGTYFTNSSSFSFPFPSTGNLIFSIMNLSSISGRNAIFNGNYFSFKGNYSATRFEILEEDSYGDWNISYSEIIHSTIPPQLYLQKPAAKGYGEYVFNYTGSDPVNSTVDLYVNGILKEQEKGPSGEFTFVARHDGIYHFYAIETDLCGNTAISPTLVLNVTSFPVLSNAYITVSQFLGLGWIKAVLIGNSTSSLKYEFILDSHPMGWNRSPFTLFLPGYNNLTLLVKNGSQEEVFSKRVFSTGPAPEIAALVISLYILWRRSFRGTGDEKVLIDYIRQNSDMPVRDLIYNAYFNGLSRHAVRKFIESNRGSIFKESRDPDGNTYLSMAAENMEGSPTAPENVRYN